MDFARVLTDVRAALARAGVRQVLAGGVAIAAHGVQRSTLDLDFVVAMTDADAAVAALEALGYETLRRSIAFSNHLRSGAGERVDLLFTDDTTFAEIFARADRKPLFAGEALAVVHPEHLVAMKLFALTQNPERQGIDLEDIRALMLKRLVDRDLVSRYLVRYGLERYREALGV